MSVEEPFEAPFLLTLVDAYRSIVAQGQQSVALGREADITHRIPRAVFGRGGKGQPFQHVAFGVQEPDRRIVEADGKAILLVLGESPFR